MAWVGVKCDTPVVSHCMHQAPVRWGLLGCGWCRQEKARKLEELRDELRTLDADITQVGALADMPGMRDNISVMAARAPASGAAPP